MARVDDPHHFLDRAFEYYVTGRFAALNNLQVAPNLFHHAVEMLAKFQLLRRVPDDRLAEEAEKLKQKPYGHKLHTLWADFKADVGDSGLDRFDKVVAYLDRWERLRYARFPDGISTTMVFMMRRGPHDTWSAEPQDVYVFVLEDIDELFTAMVTASNLNPTFLGERHRCCRQVCLVIVRRNCVGMVRQHLVGRATDAAAPTGVGAVVAVMVVSRG